MNYIDMELLKEVLAGMVSGEAIGVRMVQQTGNFKITSRNFQISPREIEVCQQILQGVRGIDIADNLSISPKTVEAHMNHLAVKLGMARGSALRHAIIKEYYYAVGHREGKADVAGPS